MPFDMNIAYTDLKIKIENCIKEELRYRGLDQETDVSTLTSASDLKQLPVERLQQLQFLKSVMDNAKSRKSSHVLLGAAYFVAREIRGTYTLRTPENSKLYSSLMTAIGGGKPSDKQLYELYSTLNTFLYDRVYKEAPDKTVTHVNPPLFDLKGPVTSYIDKLIKKVANMKSTAVSGADAERIAKENAAIAAEKAAKKAAAKKSGSSWNPLSGLFGGGTAAAPKSSAKPAAAEEDADDADDADEDHSAAGAKSDSKSALEPVPAAAAATTKAKAAKSDGAAQASTAKPAPAKPETSPAAATAASAKSHRRAWNGRSLYGASATKAAATAVAESTTASAAAGI